MLLRCLVRSNSVYIDQCTYALSLTQTAIKYSPVHIKHGLHRKILPLKRQHNSKIFTIHPCAKKSRFKKTLSLFNAVQHTQERTCQLPYQWCLKMLSFPNSTLSNTESVTQLHHHNLKYKQQDISQEMPSVLTSYYNNSQYSFLPVLRDVCIKKCYSQTDDRKYFSIDGTYITRNMQENQTEGHFANDADVNIPLYAV